MARVCRLPHGRLRQGHRHVQGDARAGRRGPGALAAHRVLLLLQRADEGGGGGGHQGPAVVAAEPPLVPHRAQVQRRGEAHELPHEAAGHHRGPAVTRRDPLLPEPLPGGDRHLQAHPHAVARIPRTQRLRRAVLLQARLLRRVQRGAQRVPAGPPRLRRRHQPQGVQPVPAVHGQGRRGRARGARQDAGHRLQRRAPRRQPQPVRLPQRRGRAASAAAAAGRDPRGAAQPRRVPPAQRQHHRRVRAAQEPRAGDAAGVHPQGRRQRLHRPADRLARAPQARAAALPARRRQRVRVRHHPGPAVHGVVLLPAAAVRGRARVPQVDQGLLPHRRHLQLHVRHRVRRHGAVERGRGVPHRHQGRQDEGRVLLHLVARPHVHHEPARQEGVGPLPQDGHQQRVLQHAAAHRPRLLPRGQLLLLGQGLRRARAPRRRRRVLGRQEGRVRRRLPAGAGEQGAGGQLLGRRQDAGAERRDAPAGQAADRGAGGAHRRRHEEVREGVQHEAQVTSFRVAAE
mmetsp:Transcript_3687/g.11641  ORF Transcript_3687/g.11641 Transcript_3687/m.11641 type:complete len:514 (+) Transcript_3687:243-1784(+)